MCSKERQTFFLSFFKKSCLSLSAAAEVDRQHSMYLLYFIFRSRNNGGQQQLSNNNSSTSPRIRTNLLPPPFPSDHLISRSASSAVLISKKADLHQHPPSRSPSHNSYLSTNSLSLQGRRSKSVNNVSSHSRTLFNHSNTLQVLGEASAIDKLPKVCTG